MWPAVSRDAKVLCVIGYCFLMEVFLMPSLKNKEPCLWRMKPRLKGDDGVSLLVIFPMVTQGGRFVFSVSRGQGLAGGGGVVKPLRMRPAEKREDNRDVGCKVGVIFLDLPMWKFHKPVLVDAVRNPFLKVFSSGNLMCTRGFVLR